VVIGMNSPTGGLGTNLFSGVIQVTYSHDNVISYGGGSGAINAGDPYFKLYPGTNIGKYSAWSWGISRLIDGIELVKTQMKADPSRIAVTGCSYAGKMALFGGAFDERVALTIAQESGGGGINSWRMSKAYTARTGVNVEKIDNTNYSWFKSSMKSLTPEKLPHDHHELIAMIAPRALLVLGNPTQEWLCDESGYKSCMGAAEVWKSMGVSDRFGFIFTPDHNHCAAPQAENDAATAFINKFLKNNTSANTNIRVNPTKGTKQDLTIGTGVINWTTPTLTGGFTTDIEDEDYLVGSGVRSYPNPFHSEITIEAKGDFSYQLSNQLGQLVESGIANDRISLTKEYPKGLYLLKITQDTKSEVMKLVKE